MSRAIKVFVGTSILVVFGIVVAVLIAFTNLSATFDDPTLALLSALEENDHEAAEAAVRLGADVDYSVIGQRTLLHDSVRHNEMGKVRFLIEHGANVNSVTKFGRSPLHEAALYGRYEISQLLLDAGADANARNPRGETPLLYAEVGLIVGPLRTPSNDKVAELLRLYGATR